MGEELHAEVNIIIITASCLPLLFSQVQQVSGGDDCAALVGHLCFFLLL